MKPWLLLAIAFGASSASAAKNETTVVIEAFQFSPATIHVRAGTKVVFTNKDSTPHTVTPSAADSFTGTGRLLANESATVVFAKPGTFAYFCEFHTTMKGLVIVR